MTSQTGPGPLAGGKPRRPQTAAEYVAQSLRASILSGGLRAGTRLALADVASNFDVSATPVREALRDLASEGLVQFDRYRGGTVNAVTQEEVEEIVRIRQLLEPTAIREAIANGDVATLDRAEDVLNRMSDADGWAAWVAANREFHNMLISTSPSARLVGIILELQGLTAMFVSNVLERKPDLQVHAHAEHVALLDAFRRRDAERAIDITLTHLTIPVRK